VFCFLELFSERFYSVIIFSLLSHLHFTMKTFAKTSILAVIGTFCIASVSLWAQPKLEIKGGDTYDWGTVTDISRPLVGQVEIKNVGNKDLVIYQAKPACGCTSEALERSNIKPGESTSLKFTLNVGSNSGQIIKSITITSNAEPDSTKILFLKANIVRLLQTDQFISLYPLYVGQETKAVAKIRNNDTRPVKLLEFTGNNGLKVAKKTPVTVPANSEIELPVTVVGPAQPGAYHSSILVKTDHPDPQYKLLEIRAYGENKPAPQPTQQSSPAMLPAAGSK
jgi:hypothetical protein